VSATRVLGLSAEQQDYLGLGRRGYGAIPACSMVEGELDADLLKVAVATVVNRHEPLRMRLVTVGGEVRQSFAAPDEPLRVDWFDGDVSKARDPLDTALHTDVRGVDDDDPVPLRMHMLRCGEDQTLVLALLNHLAADGWGSYLFNRELWSSYRALRTGRPADLPELTETYTDHILAQQNISPRRLRVVQEHWTGVATRYVRASNGLGVAGPKQGRGRADLIHQVGTQEVAGVIALAESLGLSANTVPLTCLLLAAWSLEQGDALALSFIYSGRDRPGLHPLVGVFHRHVPLVVDNVGTDDLGTLLHRVAALVVEGVRCSRPPYTRRFFNELVSAQGPAPSLRLLYNQVDRDFGQPRPGAAQEWNERGNARFVDSHFWPNRWAGYGESTLRVVVSGGVAPTLQAIYNDGFVAEARATALLERMAVLLGAMRPDRASQPVAEFVITELESVGSPKDSEQGRPRRLKDVIGKPVAN
jgi:hypothetical protein